MREGEVRVGVNAQARDDHTITADIELSYYYLNGASESTGNT